MIAIIPFIMGIFLIGNSLQQNSVEGFATQSLAGTFFILCSAICLLWHKLEKHRMQDKLEQKD